MEMPRVKMSGLAAYDFIRECLSHRPEPERRERIRDAIETGVDWKTLNTLAAQHRVWPLFFSRLEHLLGDQLPDSLREQFRERQRRLRIHSAFQVQELGNVAEAFEEHGVPLLSLKGPLLSYVAYGDVAMRRYVDLDVFVPRRQFSEADRLLRDMGYKDPPGKNTIEGWRRTTARFLAGQWPYVQANGAFTVDVHTRLLPPSFSFPGDFQQFWNRSTPVRLEEDVSVRGFSREDMILILAYHGLKNQWRALKHVTDLSGLICGDPDPDWNVLIRRAERMNATRVLALGLSLTQNLLDAPLPTGVEDWIDRRSVEETTMIMADYLRNQDAPSRSVFGSWVESTWQKADTRLQLKMKDTVSAQIRHIAYAVAHVIWSTVLKP
jgi:hypothetical protein